MCVQTDFKQWHMSYNINQPPAITIWVIQSVCGFRAPNSVFFCFCFCWSTFHKITDIFFSSIPFACKLYFSFCFDVNRNFHSISVCGYICFSLINVFFLGIFFSLVTFQYRNCGYNIWVFAGVMLKGFNCIISQIGKVVK